jgi:hypothetical protein
MRLRGVGPGRAGYSLAFGSDISNYYPNKGLKVFKPRGALLANAEMRPPTVLALLELGWRYRRIERETGVRRETVSGYDLDPSGKCGPDQHQLEPASALAAPPRSDSTLRPRGVAARR